MASLRERGVVSPCFSGASGARSPSTMGQRLVGYLILPRSLVLGWVPALAMPVLAGRAIDDR